MSHTKQQEKPGIGIFIDFRKAFDTVEWDFLKQHYNRLTLAPTSKTGLIPYTTKPRVASYITATHQIFFVLKEVSDKAVLCQAYFSSSQLSFLPELCKKSPTISGIPVYQNEIKVTQYADDTTVFGRDLESVSQLLKLLNDFKRVSGLEINTHETEAMWFGSWRNRKESLLVSNGLMTRFMLSAFTFHMTSKSPINLILKRKYAP